MKKIRSLKKALVLLPLLFISVVIFAQPTSISGKVSDPTGSPIPGVTVVVKGTTNGTITTIDGTFSLRNVDPNGVIVFSFVGMKQQEVAINGKSSINVTLEADISDLGEVVVVGYGVQRKEAVTGSVASISGENLRDMPSTNITQALQGRLPGVEMSQTSTKPGASMQIRIRGTRSLSASNDPLIVLDGIPFAGSISDINPNDIKSIDILKDASATAIYGSRGANGVILVTSNKGRKGQKATVSYNAYEGVKNAIKFPMMNGPELVALRSIAATHTNGEDEFDNISTDWQDLFYRQGKARSHDLGISGGTEKGSYNFGIGYYQDQAVVPTSQYTRFSLRTAIDQEIGKYVRLGLTSSNNFSLTEGSQVGLYGVLAMSPLADPYNADGSLKRIIKMASDVSWNITRDIVNDNAERWLRENKAYGSYNNLFFELKIPGVEGLKYTTNVGLNLRSSNTGSFTGRGIGSTNEETESTASVNNSLNLNWIIENILSYDRVFADKHQVNIVGLYSAEQTTYNSLDISAKDIPNEAFKYYNLGHAAGEIIVNPSYQSYNQSGLLSWMGRAMYSYDNRYMATVTLRSDGSSRLADGQKWHTYPAVSLGWNIGNESFMKDLTMIDMLKIRVGYGQTSNQAVDPYKTLGRLNTIPYNFGETFATGYYVNELPNDNLGWEYSETMNYGLDFSLLKNRLSGTFEYYVTNTKDILLNVNLPPTSGVSSYTANIGETENKGWELSLNGIILNNSNGLIWDAGVNIYSNRNTLVALASDQDRDESNWWFVGHSINVVYDYEKIGLWNEGDPYMDILEPGGNNRIGMIKVKYTGEYEADGTPTRAIGPEDRQILTLDPKFQGGFNTRIAYKGFDLGIVAAFKSGGMIISALYSSNSWLNNHTGRRNEVKKDYWTPENTDAYFPNPASIKSGENPKYGSTLGYFDASYLKIRTLTLGYSLDQRLTEKIGINKLRIYVTAQNPLVMFSPYHKLSGMDPESNSFGNENSAVNYSYNLRRLLTISANTPSTRNFMIGLNLTF